MTCACLCRLWDHSPATCIDRINRVLELPGLGGELVRVAVCLPCAEAIAVAQTGLDVDAALTNGRNV